MFSFRFSFIASRTVQNRRRMQHLHLPFSHSQCSEKTVAVDDGVDVVALFDELLIIERRDDVSRLLVSVVAVADTFKNIK